MLQCEFGTVLFRVAIGQLWTLSPRLLPNGMIADISFFFLSKSLRLKIYRSLGIEIEADEAGNYNKAIIRNSRKGDVHVVNIDPKFSRFFYANYFWQTMQG